MLESRVYSSEAKHTVLKCEISKWILSGFTKLCQLLNIVAYYLVGQPRRLLLLAAGLSS